MKCEYKRNIKKVTIQKRSFVDSWSIIKKNSSSITDDSEDDQYQNNDDGFLQEKPNYQELLTDIDNISTNNVEYSKYEQICIDYLNTKNLYDCFHGVLYYIYYYSNNKYNTNELEFIYSGSKNRKNLKTMKQNQQNDRYDIANIFNYQDYQKEFIIGNYKNASFGVNFKHIKICPVSYSIRSGYSNYYMNLISFKFQGYDSKLNRWDTLDERENTNELNYPGAYMMFFTKKTEKSYSIFRIQQTSPGQNDFWGFIISAFDIQGNISYRDDINEQNTLLLNENEIELEDEQDNSKIFSYDPLMNMSEYILI